MAEAKKALKLAKSSFTRKQNGIARIIAMASDHPSKTAVDQASSRKDFQMAYEEVMNKLNEIALLAEDDASEEGYIKSMEEIQQRYEDTLAEILAASTDIKPELPAAPSPSADQGAARANMALRPPILSLQFSPPEMKAWQRQFQAYYNSSGFHQCSISIQQEYFRACLDRQLDNRVFQGTKINSTTPVFSSDDTFTCFTVLNDAFLLEYPLFNRRHEFFTMTQRIGEKFSDFVGRLKAAGEEADLGNLSVDEMHMFRYIEGCSDVSLRKRLLEVVKPTLEQFDQVYKAYESANSQHQALDSAVAAMPLRTQHVKFNTQRQRMPRQYIAGKIKRSDLIGKCFRCGSSAHTATSCPIPSGTICHNCQKPGHLTRVCLGSQQFTSSRPSTRPHSRSASPVNAIEDDQTHPMKFCSSEPQDLVQCSAVNASTPRLRVQISQGKTSFTFAALPDTGASKTVIAADLMKRWGIMCNDQLRSPKLLAANGSPLDVLGVATLCITNNNIATNVQAIATSSISEDLLIGWQDLVALDVIDKSFPERTVASISPNHNDLRDQLISNNSDVFQDHLNAKIMHGKPMHI